MLHSAGVRFLLVSVLALLMFIPLFFVGSIIDSRASYNRETVRNISQEWGGAQALNRITLVIPVTEAVLRSKQVGRVDPITNLPVLNETGAQVKDIIQEEVVVNRAPILLSPETVKAKLSTQTELRHRGIFKVPVYKADTEIGFSFNLNRVANVLNGEEVPNWDATELRIGLATNRSLRRAAEVIVDDKPLPLEPFYDTKSRAGGIMAATGDPRELDSYKLSLGFNGAQSLAIAAIGRDTQIEMASDWPHPSFEGAFLPDEKNIREDGFTANWAIPHLARNMPQITRETGSASQTQTMRVRYFQPNDFYQKAYRAGRYGILFIALTFLTVMLVEKRAKAPAHPVQYILVGIAQSMFVLLMVAFAEQIGFTRAYVLASAATIGLITAFGATGLKLGKGAWVLGVMLVVLYTVLFLILRSADLALLAGACLAFTALAMTMYATRNEDWYSASDRPKWFARKTAKAAD